MGSGEWGVGRIWALSNKNIFPNFMIYTYFELLEKEKKEFLTS